MKAIILAAGRGSRMKEKTEELPKCLLKVQGKALLEHQIDALTQNGISEIGIVTGYQKEKIEHPKITKYFTNPLWEQTNSCYSLLQAKEWLENDTCLISYSDLFYSSACITKLLKTNENFAITYDPYFLSLWESRFQNPLEDLESFKIDSQSFITEIGKKVQKIQDVQGQYMGLIQVTPIAWQKIIHIFDRIKKEELFKLDMTALFCILLKDCVQIKAVSIENEKWGEVDLISDLQLYNSKN